MPIELTQAAVTPRSDAVSYPHAWFPRIAIDAADPNGEAEVHVEIVPFRVLEHGERELMPGATRRVHIEQLFESSVFTPKQIDAVSEILAGATTAEKLALAQVVMYAALEAKGKELGVI